MTFKKSLGSGHVFGQLVGSDDGFHVVDPRHQIAEIGQESMKVVGIIQTTFSFLKFQVQVKIFLIDFFICYYLFNIHA